jgi:nucleotide-binding universal stress UspA family protein
MKKRIVHQTKKVVTKIATAVRKTIRKPPAEKTHNDIQLKQILVPIDFSEHSKKALQYAIPFARQFQAKIIALYVVEPTIYPADFSFGQVGIPNIETELQSKGEQELKTLLTEIVGGRVPAEALVRTGLPFVEVINFAHESDIDLIIVATHGHTGVEHILFGSTAEKIVRKAPCPVLVVRSDERDFVIERV